MFCLNSVEFLPVPSSPVIPIIFRQVDLMAIQAPVCCWLSFRRCLGAACFEQLYPAPSRDVGLGLSPSLFLERLIVQQCE
jgi:hypothetical protein